MPSADEAVSTLREGFAAPPPEGRVMMRWWWFGPLVEEAELARELSAMAAAGIGGVEVASVYPLSVSDAGRFLSARPVASAHGPSGWAEARGATGDVGSFLGRPFLEA